VRYIVRPPSAAISTYPKMSLYPIFIARTPTRAVEEGDYYEGVRLKAGNYL
jgi:hypothetical protein